MKKNLRRALSLALSIIMILALATTAYADNVYDTVFSPSQEPSRTTARAEYGDVEFNGGEATEGVLDIDAEKLDAEGDYHVSVAEGTTIPQDKIPETNTADKFYELEGWVLEKDYNDGNLDKLVDLEKFEVEEDVKLIAVYKDTWEPYSDMNPDRSDWFYKYVRDLSIAGVVAGMPGGTFEPATSLTYGQALKLVMLATGYAEQAPVDAHWASGYYAKAMADGLVTETGIDLDRPIKRIEVADIAAKALKLPAATIETPYADTALQPALQLYVAEIMEGSLDAAGQRLFKPDDYITRAEVSAIVWRINAMD